MICGLDSDLRQSVKYAVEDVKEVAESNTVLDETLLIDYMLGGNDAKMHATLRRYMHIFIAYEGLYDIIISRMREYEDD